MIVNVTQFLPVITTITSAALLGFMISMVLTPIYTYLAFRHKAWKQIRRDSITGEKAKIYHKLHADKHKRNIPTMAGLIILAAVAIVTISINLSRNQTYLLLFGMLAAGAVGLVDDFINIRGSNWQIAGMRSRMKMVLITGVALLVGFYVYYKLGYRTLEVPFLDQVVVGWLLIPLFAFVIIATANAVNITDGLDGLSGGLLALAFSVYAVIAFFQGNYGIAVFCATVVGAVLSYTWFNIYPARFFMGDTGSFALGTTLGIVALLTDTVLLLPVIGGMFVIEAGSSLTQILSKKILRRKLLLSAPIHHHFEAIGWPETKVTMRFWILGAVFGVTGLILALIGGSL